MRKRRLRHKHNKKSNFFLFYCSKFVKQIYVSVNKNEDFTHQRAIKETLVNGVKM